MIGYRFEPDGLQFKTAAALTVKGIEPGASPFVAILLSTDGSATLLDSALGEAPSSTGKTALVVQLPHFSAMVLWDDRIGKFGSVALSGVPKTITVGQSFTATGTVTVLSATGADTPVPVGNTLEIHKVNGVTVTYQILQRTLSGEFEVTQNEGILTPANIPDAPSATVMGARFRANGTFTCVRPGGAAVSYSGKLTAEVVGASGTPENHNIQGRATELVKCVAPPVLKTLGCAPGVKVNQPVACRSDAAPGSPDSPLTLLGWLAPEGTPNSALGTTSFTTMFTTPGTKQISLKACSGDACTTLTGTVSITADSPPPQPLTGSGAFTLFSTFGVCDGLPAVEVMQLSLSVVVNGTAADVSVAPKGWSAHGTWTDTPAMPETKTLSASSPISDRPTGVTSAFFSIAAHYDTATKVLAYETVTGLEITYYRGEVRCSLSYSFNIQLN